MKYRNIVLSALLAVCLVVSMTAGATAAKTLRRPTIQRIKLVLLSPKLTNGRLILPAPEQVTLKFKVGNTGNTSMRNVHVVLAPRAIVMATKPSAKLISDSTGGSARWLIPKLRVGHKRYFSAMLNFDAATYQTIKNFGLVAYTRQGIQNLRLQSVPVLIQH